MSTTGWILVGVGVSSLASLATVAFMIHHRHRLQSLSDQLAEGAVDNGETLKGVVEEQGAATRRHVSHAIDVVAHNSEMTKRTVREFVEQQTRDAKEFRGQLTVQKTRIQWLIGVLDALSAKVDKALTEIRAWFHRPPDS